MSIVRVGLAETKNFADGYDLIFGKKDDKNAEQKTDEKSENKAAEQKQQEKK